MATNLGLKARAARWVAEHGYTDERDALNERYALLDEARAVGVYLWMFDRNLVDPDAQDALVKLAASLDLTGETLSFWKDAADTPEEREADLLLAEVQVALRVAAEGFVRSDDDQYNLYRALRLSVQASQTYLPQLSLDYDPRPVHDLREQLQVLVAVPTYTAPVRLRHHPLKPVVDYTSSTKRGVNQILPAICVSIPW